MLIDPTLMLDSTEWLEIEEKPSISMPDTYILTYFLSKASAETQREIETIQEIYKHSLLDVSPNVDNKNFILNPSHFIYLIHHAKYIITDSYHATIFSLLFKKPVKVVKRNDHNISMESRFDTILSSLGIGSLDELEMLSRNDKFDFYKAFDLCSKRKAAISFLVKALEENEYL